MSGNIKVVVRCRPLNSREKARGAPCLIRMEGNKTIIDRPPTAGVKTAEESKAFTFDQSYWSADTEDPDYADQERVYNDLGRELLDHAFNGYNCCIFAYGQTGSGKSYSMMGYGEDKGIIPRTCSELFDRVASKKSKDLDFQVEVSYIEIYNEKVRDLLNPKNKGNLKVREHPVLGPYVQDLSRLAVNSFENIDQLMDEGNKARTVAATNMNETSSRSHAVFTIFVTQKKIDPITKQVTDKVARISLVDLAGSERANSTGATGVRLKEGANINKSLTTLGKVIAGLAEQSSAPEPKKGSKKPKESFVPFRDSVLTWLLKDSLGGNSKTCMIAAISPADYDETISTLRYADQAKKIKTKAVVNEDPSAKVMRELKDEVEALRQALMVYAPDEVEKITEKAHPVKAPSAAVVTNNNKLSPAAAAVLGKPGPGITPKPSRLSIVAAPVSSKSTVVFTDASGKTTQLTKDEMVEQLHMTERLLDDLKQTWEEKLQKTQQIHVERETTLKKLGITIEKNEIGLYTPKEIPYLINLNEDPLMSECLMYNIKPGKTYVHRSVSEEDSENEESTEDEETAIIRLNGSNIKEKHCYFENVDEVVTLYPHPNCITMVNGMRISEPKRLKSSYRIILGDYHVFRFNNPSEALKEQQQLQQQEDNATSRADSPMEPPSPISSSERDRCLSPPPPPTGEVMDWNFARREAMLNTYINDSNFGNFTDGDLDKLFDDVAKVRVIRKRQSTCSDTLSRRTSSSSSVRHSVYSNPTSSVFMDESVDGYYTTDTSTMSSASSSISSLSNEELLLLSKGEQEIQLEYHRKKYEAKLHRLSHRYPSYTPEPLSLTPREKALVYKVAEHWKRKRNVAMAKVILKNDVHVRQANSMAAKANKDVFYQFAVIHDNVSALSVSHYEPNTSNQQQKGAILDPELIKAAKPCVGIQVVDKKHQSIYIWSVEKFNARLRYLQGAYFATDSKKHLKGDDLFYECVAPTYTLLGVAKVPLRNLATQVPVESELSVHCHHTGRLMGKLKAQIAPIARSVRHTSRPDEENEEENDIVKSTAVVLEEDPRKLLHVGQQLVFEISVMELSGLDPKEFNRAHVQFRLSAFGSNLDGVFTSDVIGCHHDTPMVFNYHQTLSMAITEEILHSIETKNITFEVYGKPSKDFIEDLSSTIGKNNQNTEPVEEESTAVTDKKTQDVTARIQICEITSDGDYIPVPVECNNVSNKSDDSNGSNNGPKSAVNNHFNTFSLQQGQQRRIVISLDHHTTKTDMPLEKIVEMKVGRIRLMDGKTIQANRTNHDIPLNLISSTSTDNRLTVHGSWDSSLHNTLFLDAITGNTQKVIFSLSWLVCYRNLATNEVSTVRFEKDVYVHIKDHNKAATIKKKSNAGNSSLNLNNKRASVILNFFSKPNYTKNQVTGLFAIHYKPDIYKNINQEYIATAATKDSSIAAIAMLSHYNKERLEMIKREQVDAIKYTVFLSEQLERLFGNKVEQIPSKTLAIADIQPIVDFWTNMAQQTRKSNDLSSIITTGPIKASSMTRWIPQAHQIVIPDECKSKKGFLLRKNKKDDNWEKYWSVLAGNYLHLYANQYDMNEADILCIKSTSCKDDTENNEEGSGDDIMEPKTIFTLDTLYDSYTFQAQDGATMNDWVSLL